MADKHHIVEANAAKIYEWLATRGGVALWRSVNLSNPGASWSTPALNTDGTPVAKPTWQADSKPERIITDPADIVVDVPLEVRRFRVAVRISTQGMSLKLTDASTRKVRAAVEKAAERRADKEAWYEFDYTQQQAVIYVPGESMPLDRWAKRLVVYECGICDQIHPWNWNGDCRDDANRYGGVDEYAKKLGVPEHLIVVLPMEDRVKADEEGA